MKKAFAFLITISLSLPALADYHYASHSGSNVFPYTSWETAADSIQNAVNAASPRDTVFIGGGEYFGQVILDTDSLSLIGQGWDSTLVWLEFGNGATIQIVSNHFYSYYVEGLHIQNRSGYWCLGNCVRTNLHVNRCRFSNPQNPSDGAGVATGTASNEILIENCLFDSIQYGFSDILGGSYTEVRNCIFDTYENGITFDNQIGLIKNNIFRHGQFNSEPVFGGSESLIAENNLIYDNTTGFEIGSSPLSSRFAGNTMDFRDDNIFSIAFNNDSEHKLNNSVSNIAYLTWVDPGDSLHLSYNNLWRVHNLFWSQNGVVDTSGGNLRDYPMFVGDDDYHLQAFSLLIDAGDPAILDIDGSRSDIGAYGGPGGGSYVYQDLPPLMPDSLAAHGIGDTVSLVWRQNYEADLLGYQIFRDTVSGFVPSSLNFLIATDTAFYIDTDISSNHNYYYRIAAEDNQHNLSGYSPELAVILTDIWGHEGAEQPQITEIQSNYPNPFNSHTTIVYSVANLGPIPAQINIDIYDILGRLVRKLVDTREGLGIHQITWDGRDDGSRELPSGVYFAKITQWNAAIGNKPKKMVLMK